MLAALARPQFQLQPVIDLRSGLPAALTFADEHQAHHDAPTRAAVLRDAFALADAASIAGPLQWRVQPTIDNGEALALAATLEAISRGPRALDVVLDEQALAPLGYASALSVAQTYRACGFGVVLETADAPFMAFGAHTRAAFTEVRLTPPQAHAQTTRLYAASEAGLLLTVAFAQTRDAKALLALGFDRAIQ